jgi:hypothetical protein
MIEREQAYTDLLLSKSVDGGIFAPTSLSIQRSRSSWFWVSRQPSFIVKPGARYVVSIRIDNLEACDRRLISDELDTGILFVSGRCRWEKRLPGYAGRITRRAMERPVCIDGI